MNSKRRFAFNFGGITKLNPLLKLALSLGLLAFFLSRIGWRQVWAGLAAAHYGWFLLAVGTYGLGVLVRALRWQALLESWGAHASVWRLSALSFVGFYFNTFLPTGYGGDVVRAVEAARFVPGPVAVSSLVADRGIGLLGVCLLALATLPFSLRGGDPSLRVMGAAAGAVAAALVIGFWLIKHHLEKNGPKIFRLLGPFFQIPSRSMARPLAYALLFGLTNALTYAFIGQAVRLPLPFSYYLLASPLITLILLIPLAFNGVGTRDAAYLLLFTPLGVPPAAALAMSLLYHLLNLVAALVGGALYLGTAATHR